MNERIKELADYAYSYASEQAVEFSPEFMGYHDKKFAELIVNQCADIAQQHNKSPVAAPLAIGYVIREHFGVQE